MHTTAQKGAAHPKKFKGHPWPSVATAVDALEAEDKQRLADANRQFMAMFEFVPQDEFEAELAEHVEALEAGAERSPVQQRAEAAAWGQPMTPAFSAAPGPLPQIEAPSDWSAWPTAP